MGKRTLTSLTQISPHNYAFKKFLNHVALIPILRDMTEAYVVKVSSVGQVTLPKEIREKLAITPDDYIIIQQIGETYFIKKLDQEKDLLAKIRKRVKKSGITREQLDKIIEEESENVYKKHQGLP
jgi:AbrB family looped-hinge helix DNA binding protein